MRFVHTVKYCSLLLLAFLATASFQGNGNGLVHADEQANTNSYGGRVLVRRSDEVSRATTETSEKVCGADEQDTIGLKKRIRKGDRKGERIPICEWVAMRRRGRCKRTHKRKGIDLKDYCKCTCKGVETRINPPQAVCPSDTVSPETELHGRQCTQVGQECGYRYIATGCRASEYMCLPIVNCFCGPNLTYSCQVHMAMGPVECPAAPSRPPPADWEEPPPGIGAYCDPENPPFASPETIQL